MQKCFLNIILLLLCATSIAQSNFHNIYDYQNRSDGGYEIIESKNDFVVFGFTSSGGFTSKFLKVDSFGNTLFHKGYVIRNDDIRGGRQWFQGYYGFGAHFDPVEGSADSHFMYINNNGDSTKVVKIDFEFNDRIRDAILLKDSTFIVLGFYTDTNVTDEKPFVAHVDSLGSILWMKTHNDSTKAEILDNIEATKDGGYVFGGYRNETPQGWQELFMVKVDSVGNFEWEQVFGTTLTTQTGGNVIACKDGGYAMLGQKAVFVGTVGDNDRGIYRTDSAGNILWEKAFGDRGEHEIFLCGEELPNGDFILAGTSIRQYNNQDTPDIILSRLDSAGNLLWSRDFTYAAAGPQVHDYVKDIKVTSDSGFVLTGFITNVAGPRLNDVFILKTDGNGLITSVNSGFREVPEAWIIYPNPTQGQITISDSQNIKQIQVYNLQGQKVQEFSSNTTGTTQVQLDGPSGIYLIQLQKSDGSWESVKVIKQ